MEKKLRMAPGDVLVAARQAVRFARNGIDDVEFSCEDAGRSDLDFLCRIIEAVIKEGASTINIPDTVGYNVPEQYANRIHQLRERIPNSDKVIWSVHCHNDLGLAVANSLAAVMAGARQVECTINGLGERAGNAALEEIVMAVHTRQDVFPCSTRIDTTQIVAASKMVSSITGFPVQPNKAIVGANAFAHESGIHQDGVLKHRETYEIMRAEDVGWNANKLVLGKHSGRTAFKARLKELGIEVESEQVLNWRSPVSRNWPTRSTRSSTRILHALMSDEMVLPDDEHYKLVSSMFHSETGEVPQARLTLSAGGHRAACRVERQRSGGCDLQGDRKRRRERFRTAALFGERHHHGYRCARRSDGAPGEGRSHRQRAGRRYGHRGGFRQGLYQRPEQAVFRAGKAQSTALRARDGAVTRAWPRQPGEQQRRQEVSAIASVRLAPWSENARTKRLRRGKPGPAATSIDGCSACRAGCRAAGTAAAGFQRQHRAAGTQRGQPEFPGKAKKQQSDQAGRCQPVEPGIHEASFSGDRRQAASQCDGQQLFASLAAVFRRCR
jgi:isopropylmalate/homocitrate/citramalate synthase